MTELEEDAPVVQAAQFTWTHDGHLRTPCHQWCSIHCDGTAHASEGVDVDLKYRGQLLLNVVQPTSERYPTITIEDQRGERRDSLTPDQAERLAHVLLDHAKIARAATAEECSE